MAKVLKAKYFENIDIMNAPLGAKPSYAWRSILHGRELLEKGLKRSVGNGRSLMVWTDCWLEDEDGACRPPFRRQRSFNVNLKVSDLIDLQTRRWDERMMREIFVPRDINILRKNQPVVSDQDSWIWKLTRNEVYSVKSGYDLAFLLHNQELLEDQNAKPSLNPLKAQVWNVKAPSKIKVLFGNRCQERLRLMMG